jgi:hypothetical protein
MRVALETARRILSEVLQMKAADDHPKGSMASTRILAVLLVLSLIVGGDSRLSASPQEAQKETAEKTAEKLSPEQLDSLVAPIALYPDPLLSQTLVASTYPLEIIQLHQWLAQNKKLKDKELAEAVKKQDWDPSIQAMAPLPDVVKQLAENIKWTADLGNAFLAQQSEVMDAVQRMRAKAKEKGNLKTNEQQKVEVKTVESKQVIVIEQASPEVIYVPSYNPTVVYGAPFYPYPPIYYPPVGYYAAGMAISFGVGVAMGAAWGGGWGWNSGWGGNNDININRNNTFVNNSNRSVRGGNRSGTWQHNPQHRGGAPYSDRATANRYGGTARGESLQSRQANAQSRQGNAQSRQANAQSRQSSGMEGRGGSGSSGMNRSSSGSSSGSANRGGGFGGGGGGFSGSSARASSSRGASSMGSRGGGGRGGGRRR